MNFSVIWEAYGQDSFSSFMEWNSFLCFMNWKRKKWQSHTHWAFPICFTSTLLSGLSLSLLPYWTFPAQKSTPALSTQCKAFPEKVLQSDVLEKSQEEDQQTPHGIRALIHSQVPSKSPPRCCCCPKNGPMSHQYVPDGNFGVSWIWE